MGAKSAIVMPSSCLPHTAETINIMTPPIDHATHLSFLSAACTCCPAQILRMEAATQNETRRPLGAMAVVFHLFHLSVAALLCYLGAEASSC